MTGRALIASLARRLAGAGIEGARTEAWLLLEAATGRGRIALMTEVAGALDDATHARLEALLARRCAREPMAYVLGEKEFWSLPLAVGPGVLIPRPDSESVVEAALAALGDGQASSRLLDLGTGSGCLLLALLSEWPGATGVGVDASPAAVAIARANAERLGLAPRARFRVADWGEGLTDRFDLIVANPPYVAAGDWPGLQPEIRDFEPSSALLAGPAGLDSYRALAPHAARLLAMEGRLVLEIGQGQGDAVAAILGRHQLSVIAKRSDLAGIERCLVARHRP